MADHLWPARAEHLRRGTPVVVEVGFRGLELFALVGSVATSDETGTRAFCLYASQKAPDGYAPLGDIHLDLRDVTARAHAAMAHTELVPDDYDVPVPMVLCVGDLWCGDVAAILCRMRALDEDVTVAEARAALAWAEGVRDGN